MISPEDIIAKYASTAREFDGFRAAQRHEDTGHLHRIESAARLGQCYYALRVFRQIDREECPEGDLAVTWVGGQFDRLRFFGESFYYFGWRLQGVLKKMPVVDSQGVTTYPFSSLDAKGINTARNRLIEHGDKRNGIIATTFLTDTDSGFVMQ